MKRSLAITALAIILTAAGAYTGCLALTAPLVGVPAFVVTLAASWHVGDSIARSAAD